MDDDLSAQPGLGAEDFPGFPADNCPSELPDLVAHHSTLADVLKEKPDLYRTLCGQRTRLGVGLGRCIKTGIDNRGHPMVKTMGVVAADPECYDVFRELFDPVIQRHICAGADLTDLGAIAGRHPPVGLAHDGLDVNRVDVSGRFVVSAEIRVSRCLADFRFPPAMSRDEFEEVERLLTTALLDLPGELQGDYHALRGSASYAPQPGGMERGDEAVLGSRGMLFYAPDSTLRLCSGSARHWPHGRGVFTNQKKDLNVWVNEQEHLRVSIKRQGDGLQSCYKDLAMLFRCMERAFDESRAGGGTGMFASSERLGYLLSNPMNLGTGLQAFVVVRLPLLAARSDRGVGAPWQAWCGQQRVQVRPANVQNTYQPPDMFELTNLDRFGFSEVDVLNLLMKVTSYLIQMEMRLEAAHPIDDLLATSLNGAQEGKSGKPDADEASQVAAALLLDGLFSTVVADLKPLPEDGEAEEIYEPIDVPKEPRTLGRSPAPCSRPNTGASVWTLNTASDRSNHTPQAEDLVANLIDAEMNKQATALNGIDFDKLRDRAFEVLTLASEDGTLDRLVMGMVDQKGQQPQHPEASQQDMREKAREAVLSSLEDGSLEAALTQARDKALAQKAEQEAQAAAATKVQAVQRGRMARQNAPTRKAQPAPAADLFDLRAKAHVAFAKAFADGSLQTALEEVCGKGVDEDAAATKLQAAQRGRRARQTTQKMKEEQQASQRSPEDVEQARRKACEALLKAADDGSLQQLCVAVREAQPGTAAGYMQQGRDRACEVLLAAASNGSLEGLLRVVREELKATSKEGGGRYPPPLVPMPPSKPKVGAAPPRSTAFGRFKKEAWGGMRSAAAILLDAVSERDRRIGELTALVRETQVRIIQQEEQCSHMQGLVATARTDLGHIELDLEWHRRALEGAECRRCELELGQRKLRFDLDQKHLEKKHIDTDSAMLGLTARSEFSTSTVSTVATAPRQHLPGAVLEPLALRR